MSTSLALGQELTHNNKLYLVVRIIDKSVSLFEDEGECYVLEESYAELRGPNNEIDFIPILESTRTFEKTSKLPALPVLPWRMKR